MSKNNSYDDSSSIAYRGHRHRVIYGPGYLMTIKPVNYCYTETVHVPSYDAKSGRFRRVKQVKLFNSIMELSKYKVSDFYLENQIETGSVNQLSPIKMINNDTSASEMHLLNILSSIDDINVNEK